ncbi:crossover junction endonuclease EME1 [Lepus europaeus]|uniref:crossover junction endonuclease EME1 n=1 Tax=Lepus europaeus TaxID=9983 RepID=UPI002B47B0EC|nr:crossover junction endonuclease EME1 [Lepus europaeus]XP_062031752.1 crossover junction endonuclease EME1 [Lepus europaeus]XP_062031753.1 crossover junction endonuclease EME1 [Lepus europaeus]XP_062031754.1 crossover junction endonuclease EME1 [Lepus europaeus]
MALKKSPLSLESSGSESEELPTFAFLKKESFSTKKRQEKVIVVVNSDSEGSCPPSPEPIGPSPGPDTEEALPHTEPVPVLSSGSEDEEEFIPLAERLTCKFLTHKPLSPEDSSSPIKSVLDHQSNEGASCDRIPNIPAVLHGPSGRNTSSGRDPILDSPCRQPAAYRPSCALQSDSLTVTKANLDIPPPQKTATRGRKVGGWRQQGQASRKESPPRQQGRKKEAPVSRLKAPRPEECLKHIVVVLDPELLQTEGGGQLLGALQSMECHCVVEAQAVPCSVTWRRRAGPPEDGEAWAEEPMVLVVLLVEAFVSMVHNVKQGSVGSTEEGKETLRGFVTDVTARTAGKALSLVIVDQEKLFSPQNPPKRRKQGAGHKQAKEKQQQRQPKAKTGRVVSRVDMEEALVDLQLHTEAQVRIVQNWKELADFACAFTKAVAEAPFKKLRDESSFSFCLESDWAGGVKVDRSGRGLALVWRRQIQQLNRVSLEMASAVVDAYPSPQLLVQAYRRCFSVQERQNLLADIQVRRGEGVTSTSRRVGLELSRRIYLQMTTSQPDLSLDSAD